MVTRLNENEHVLQQDLARRTDYENAITPIALAEAQEAADAIARKFELEEQVDIQATQIVELNRDIAAKDLQINALTASSAAQDTIVKSQTKLTNDLTGRLKVAEDLSAKATTWRSATEHWESKAIARLTAVKWLAFLALAAAAGDAFFWYHLSLVNPY